MWSFRNKNAPVEQSLTEPTQQRAWVVWLLSIVTFFLTVAIVLGLFWAGRWVVQRFTKEPASAPTKGMPAASNERSGDNQAAPNASTPSSGSSSNPSNPPASTPPSTPSNNTQQTTPSTPTPPVTGPSTLVNTGPDSDE